MIKVEFCPLCQSSSIENIIYMDGPVKVNFCKDCGFGFLAERMEDTESDEFYQCVFQDKRRAINSFEEAVGRLERKNSYKVKMSVLPFFTQHLNSTMSVLEIGCGWGTLSKVLKDNIDCKIAAIELSELAVQVARDYYGLDVVRGYLSDFIRLRPEAKCDAVLLYHVFEHIPDLHGILEEIKCVLKPGGLLLLALPNLLKPAGSPSNFFHLGHVSYFSPNTIHRALREHGYVITDFNCTNDDMKIVANFCTSGVEFFSESKFAQFTVKKVRRAIGFYLLKYRLLQHIKRAIFIFVPANWEGIISKFIAKLFKKIGLVKS